MSNFCPPPGMKMATPKVRIFTEKLHERALLSTRHENSRSKGAYFHGKVFEIEYLTVHPEHRKEPNLERILYTIAEYARLKKMKYGIALIKPLFFQLLKRIYRIPIYQLGEIVKVNRITNSYQVLPVLIDAESVYKNISKYDWLYKIYELDNNLYTRGAS